MAVYPAGHECLTVSEPLHAATLRWLDVERFEAAGRVTAAASTAAFELPASGGNLVWRTRNELAVVSGYATLDCVNPVVAQVLFARIDGGMRPTAMATVFSSQTATVFISRS